MEPDEVKLAAVEQLPLNLVAGLQADGGGQGQRETHIHAGILSTRTDPQSRIEEPDAPASGLLTIDQSFEHRDDA